MTDDEAQGLGLGWLMEHASNGIFPADTPIAIGRLLAERDAGIECQDRLAEEIEALRDDGNRLLAERDEARAEVDRLHRAMTDMYGPTWADGVMNDKTLYSEEE